CPVASGSSAWPSLAFQPDTHTLSVFVWLRLRGVSEGVQQTEGTGQGDGGVYSLIRVFSQLLSCSWSERLLRLTVGPGR
ncbi:hypothetical protein KUDE01_019636, partial [Dissostichus eleginoides]